MVYALGAIKNREDSRDIPVGAVQSPVALPASYKTDISMIPVLDQKQLGACVGHAHATILAYLEYIESGKIKAFSPRDLYALAKKLDGYPGQGTQPRIVDDIMFNHGCALTDLVPNDTSLSHDEYINVAESLAINKQAAIYKIKGYAFVPVDSQELMQSVYQNKLVSISIQVGDYNSAPMKLGTIGWHRVVVYGWEQINGDIKFFFRNSWSELWGDKGNGYFLWSESTGHVQDLNTYVDIPDTVIEEYVYPTIKLGSTGDAVKSLQKKLGIDIDGTFGPKTKAAVISFQKKYNLAADGVVGKKTWSKVNIVDLISIICLQEGIEPIVGISVAFCESGLNPKATLYNPPSNSTDRGLYQWNSKYHAEITDAVAFDPSGSCHLFCKAVKNGKLHAYWSASEPNWKKRIPTELLIKYGIKP